MILLGRSIQGYAKIIHICSLSFNINFSMYTRGIETTLYVQLMNLFNYIFNVLYFQIFNHTSCKKHNVLRYGVQEANTIDVHEVTSQGESLVFITDLLGGICYHGRLHILYIVVDCFALQIWHTGSIDFLSHTNIFSQD